MAELIQYANGVPGIRWPVDKPVLLIGRCAEKNDIWLDDAFVSKKHARLIVKRHQAKRDVLEFFLEDLESTNHTYVNQDSIGQYQLQHNDVVMIGKNKFVFVCEDVKEYLSIEAFKGEETEQIEKAYHVQAELEIEEESQPELSSPTLISPKARFSRRINIY
ncbi:MAG: FHA domain-containing protein [Gammaproteobacteria bacterium]|nr:FHA domain-containing protein [Gammaproteobacteria bacterium]MDH5778276.1 FHA domain-containing protein [Gammaproteobacteria bacterium]